MFLHRSAYACLLGVPPVRVGLGYPTGLPGRVLPVTGSGSHPKPAGFFGPGARVPVYPVCNLSPWSACVCLVVCIDVGPSNATERAWISAARAAVAAPIYALHPPLPASKAVLSLLSLLVICPLIPPGEVQAGTEISRWCQLSGCGISSYHALYKYQVHL